MCTSARSASRVLRIWLRVRPRPRSSGPTMSVFARRAGSGDFTATIERIASLGWLARLTLRLADGHTLVAHVPQEELDGAKEGDTVTLICATRRRSSVRCTAPIPMRSTPDAEIDAPPSDRATAGTA